MSSFNRVILLGNLTRSPVLKFLPSQTAIVEFGMATNRRFKVGEEQREEVTFVDCAAFGKIAEVINEHCQKGKPLLIEGRLKFDQWEDKQGGGKRSRLSIVVENFQFVGGRDEQERQDGDDGDQRRDYQRNRQTAGATSKGMKPADAAGDEMDLSDVPFAWEGNNRQPL